MTECPIRNLQDLDVNVTDLTTIRRDVSESLRNNL
jgi:hypothetical protein